MIPSSLYNISSISCLEVTLNHLHGSLPPDLGLTLPNLEGLYVAGNKFTGLIPVSLGNASRLVHLDFGGNNFSGSVPTNLGNLRGLNFLNFENNQLGGGKDENLSFITSLTNCSDLQRLALEDNQFRGILPSSIANLSTQLEDLWLGGNRIFGTIPIGIENLNSLILLSVNDNFLTGTIPISLGKLRNLQVVALNGNRMSGQIPSSLGNLTELYQLYLSGNDLHGTIPSSLENCQHLQVLLLSSNNLNGTIPKQVFNIPSLINLYADMNYLTGSLPFDVGKLENLEWLNISNNKLSGEIPSTLGSCIKLEYLYIEGNFFQGSIPSSLSALKGIQELDLSHNNLSGQIPKYLEHLPFLQYLDLSFNNLEGEVPNHGIFQNESAISIIGNIKLCGGISKLHLPTCPKVAFKKHGRAFSPRATIAGVVAIVLFLFLLSCFIIACSLKKFSKKPASESSMRHPFLEVTYAELLKATDGFSSANLIGVGSYGSVYKGIIDRFEKTVAIKVLKLQQRRASKSFIAECKALRSIKHRNIVKILTVCSSIDFGGNDFKALVFEYMPNGSLDSWLHPNVNEHHQLRNLNFIQRINVAIDVACALDYLHENSEVPVVHCDLKPSNILLDDDMVAHVSDFGLASILGEDVVNSSQTQSSLLLMKGTIGYVAPEYSMGGHVSTYGDIYSYGILLLEMFIGKRPTDDMFEDNISLHQFAKISLPERVMEIIDRRLLSEEMEIIRCSENCSNMRSITHECLVSLVRIGVSCSAKSPKERMEMRDVIIEMHKVKDLYLGIKHNKGALLTEGPSYLSNY